MYACAYQRPFELTMSYYLPPLVHLSIFLTLLLTLFSSLTLYQNVAIPSISNSLTNVTNYRHRERSPFPTRPFNFPTHLLWPLAATITNYPCRQETRVFADNFRLYIYIYIYIGDTSLADIFLCERMFQMDR